MIRICRDFGQPPSWWDSLSRQDRVAILAEYTLTASEQGGG